MPAAYSFDGAGDTIADLSGNGNDFSIAGRSVTRVPGHTAEGMRSTGTTLATLPDVGRTAARTVMAWLDFTNLPTSWPIIWNAPSINSGAWGILKLSNNICIQARNAAALARAQVAWPGSGPHHVTGTFDASTVRLYLDGVLAASAPLAGPLRTDTDPPALFLDAGAMTSGYLDDLRILDEALNQAAIAALMATPVSAESLEEITGTGASTAPPAAAAGSGTVTVAGSGTSMAAASTAAAAAAVATSASSAATARAAVAAGAANAAVGGSGVAVAPAAHVASGGLAEVGGSGAAVALAARVAGAGLVGVGGSGVAFAPAAAAGGGAVAAIVGAASSTAPPAIAAGSSAPTTAVDRLARTLYIPAERRTVIVPAERRMVIVPAEDRTISIPGER